MPTTVRSISYFLLLSLILWRRREERRSEQWSTLRIISTTAARFHSQVFVCSPPSPRRPSWRFFLCVPTYVRVGELFLCNKNSPFLFPYFFMDHAGGGQWGSGVGLANGLTQVPQGDVAYVREYDYIERRSNVYRGGGI